MSERDRGLLIIDEYAGLAGAMRRAGAGLAEFAIRCGDAGVGVDLMRSVGLTPSTDNPDRYLPRSKYPKAHQGDREIARRAKRMRGKS